MVRTFNTQLVASTVVRLRRAMRGNDRLALQGVIGDLEARVAEADSLSKTEAANLLGVSVNTLDKWIGRGLVPTVKDGRHKRLRVPVQTALALAGEVDELRHLGYQRGLLAEAISRLEQRDPEWQRAFEDRYGDGLRAAARGDLIPIDPNSFGPND